MSLQEDGDANDSETKIYDSYDPTNFTVLNRYRIQNDIVGHSIIQSRSEGIGRIEVGHKLGINTKTKGGNRKVSNSIQLMTKNFPDHIGQYQKVEGKYRMLKYYYKGEDANPTAMKDLYEKVEALIGKPFPFKTGEVVKFPNEKLNTLRISDVTVRRMLMILEMLKEEDVIITISRLVKTIVTKEAELGYKFVVDKKSVMKCLHALARKHLVRMLSMQNVYEDDMIPIDENERIAKAHTIQIVAPMEIDNVNDERIKAAVHRTIAAFQSEGRVFPTGHLRFIKKHDHPNGIKVELPADISNVDYHALTVPQRFALLRYSFEAPKKVNKNETVASQEEEEIQYDPNVSYGYQSKMLRCAIVHEYIFLIVHLMEETENNPCLYHRFPPGYPLPKNDDVGTPIEEIPIFDDTPDSPYRFVSAFPKLEGVQRGWFMCRDVLLGMPLSIYCTVIKIKQRVPGLEDFLNDPIRRHLPLADLPPELRRHLFTRKACTALEHVFLMLCTFGHMRTSPSFDNGRSAVGPTAMFYCGTKTHFYDTSSSDRGYSTITPPITRYPRYDYEFKELDDIKKYWNHLKAVALSTPLNVRHLLKEGDDSKEKEIEKGDCRKYAFGCIDRSQFFVGLNDGMDVLEPTGSKMGCAGMDTGMYIHLQRHWEWVSPRSGDFVDWYIKRSQQQATQLADYVEPRVAQLEKNWNSFVSCLLPTDLDLLKKKKMNLPILSRKSLDAMSSNFRRHYSVRRSLHTPNESKRKSIVAIKRPKIKQEAPDSPKKSAASRKRTLDVKDLESQEKNMFIRSRFITREYDMLVLIRAVSFFLNPIHRFWLNATVMRDVMHEFVPESRCKTVNCLMAAGAREMMRPGRMQQLQYIVKTLQSHQSMNEIRSKIAETVFEGEDQKHTFFMEAFRKAYNYVFDETDKIPQITDADSEFDNFMQQKNLAVVVSGSNNNNASNPRRSRAPETVEDISHVVAFNVIMSSLISDSKDSAIEKDNCFEYLVSSVPAKSLTEALETGRSDGIITRIRNLEHTSMMIRNQATFSTFYRHFFNHPYRNDLIDLIQAHQSADSTSDVSLNDENPAWLLQLLGHFYEFSDGVDIDAPDDVNQLISEKPIQEDKFPVTKQLRHLETAILHLDNIKVYADRLDGRFSDVPKLETSLEIIAPKYNTYKGEGGDLEGKLLHTFIGIVSMETVRRILKEIGLTTYFGLTFNEIQNNSNLDKNTLKNLLNALVFINELYPVGVDQRRWVTADYVKPWMVSMPDYKYFSRPWSLPNGDISWPVLRWMAEGVLMSISYKPGMTLEEIQGTYAFVLQPTLTLELLELLEHIGCIKLVTEETFLIKKSSPFTDDTAVEEITFMLPCTNAMEMFASFFSEVISVTNFFHKYDASFHSKPR